MNIKRKLPPYAKNIPPNQDYIIVCTGSGAWGKAKVPLNNIIKTVLPYKDDISLYQWRFCNSKEVVIFSSGKIEHYERLVELSRAILAYGAKFVKWCIPAYPYNRFISKEAL